MKELRNKTYIKYIGKKEQNGRSKFFPVVIIMNVN